MRNLLKYLGPKNGKLVSCGILRNAFSAMLKLVAFLKVVACSENPWALHPPFVCHLSSCARTGYRCQAAWIWRGNNRSAGQPFVSDKYFGCHRGPGICFSMVVNPIQLHGNGQEEMPSSKWIFSCKIVSHCYFPPPRPFPSRGGVCFRLKHFCWHPGGFHAAVGLITYVPFQNPGQKIPQEKLPYCGPFTNLKKPIFPLLM